MEFKPKTRQRILLGTRVFLGLLFLLSGAGKLIDSNEARYLVELMATEIYWLIEYAGPVVLFTSLFEILLGGLLLWGRYLRETFIASFLLLLFFSAVLTYFLLQGFSVEGCGCFGAFGGGGGLEVTLARNVALMGLVIGGYLLSLKKAADAGTAQVAEGEQA